MRGKSKLKEFIKRRPSDDVIQSFQTICNGFWDSLMESIEDIKEYTNELPDSSKYRNRNGGNILFRPIVLIPFIKVTVKVMSERDLSAREVFEMFPKHLLSIDNIIWRSVIWNREKQTMITNNKSLTEKLILYYIDKELMSEKELESMITDYKSLKQLQDNEEIIEMLEDNRFA